MLKWVAGKQKGPPGTVGPQLSMGFCYSSLKKNLAVISYNSSLFLMMWIDDVMMFLLFTFAKDLMPTIIHPGL